MNKTDLADIETIPGEPTMEQRLEEREGSWGSIDGMIKDEVEQVQAGYRQIADRFNVTTPESMNVFTRTSGMAMVLGWVIDHWDFVWERIDQ